MSCQITFAFLVSILSFSSACKDTVLDICEKRYEAFYLARCDSLELRSPNYPSNYSNNMDCKITIATYSRESPKIIFYFFEMENKYDFLSISNGGSETDKIIFNHSGSVLPSIDSSISFGQMITVRFKTDNSVNRTGFKLTVYDRTRYSTISAGIQSSDSCTLRETLDHRHQSLSSKLDTTKIEQDQQKQLLQSVSSKLDATTVAQDQLLQSISSKLDATKVEQDQQKRLLQSLSSQLNATATALKELKASMITKDEMLAMLSVMYDRR